MTTVHTKLSFARVIVALVVFTASIVIAIIASQAAVTTRLSKRLGDTSNVFQLHSAAMNVPQLEQLNIQPPSLCYFLHSSGLGSSLINLFVNAAYFKDTQNRSLGCVCEHQYRYRLNSSAGVLTGFFTPQFPVIDVPEQLSLLKPYLMGYETIDLVSPWFIGNTNGTNELRQYNANNPPVILLDTWTYRDEIIEWYRQISGKSLYARLVYDMCPHLQFNDRSRAQILKLRKKHRIPDAFNNTNNIDNNNTESTTIGFHIRRGDKLQEESRKFEADEYLQRFQDQAGIPVVKTLKHCFVASDDPVAVQEFRQAIQQNRNWSCRVHAFPRTRFIHFPHQHKTYLFLTELSVLMDATYFVGTFNSNVGSLVALLRSCGRRFDKDFIADYDYFHYGQSYGADQDDWFFW